MKKHIAATALMAAAMMSGSQMTSGGFYHGHHAGGNVRQSFDMASIMHARKNNQRNKNQRRMRGGH